MDFYKDINTYIIRTHNLQSVPEEGISPLNAETIESPESSENPYSNNKSLSRNAKIGINFYGSKDMIHGYSSSPGGIYGNAPMPFNHLDHNRSHYDSITFGPFTYYHDEIVYAESMKGKLLICFDLNDNTPPKWCELATLNDIPPIIPIYIYTDINIPVDVVAPTEEDIVMTEYDTNV